MRNSFELESARNPIDATFELTVRCNMQCKMCMFRQDGTRAKELTAEEWIKIGEEAAEMGTGSLLITGGEPMLRQDFCEIYEAIYKKGFITTLYTNATLVDDRIMALLEKYPPHKIGISIYGASPETYKKVCGNADFFKKAVEGAGRLVTLPSVIEFRTTIIQDNYEDRNKIEELIKRTFGEKYGLVITRMVLNAVRGSSCDVASCRLSPEDNVLLSQHKAIDKLKEIVGEAFDIKNVRFRHLKRNSDCEGNSQEKFSLLGCSGGMRSYCVTYDGCLQACQVLGQFTTDVKADGLKKAWENFPFAVKLPPMNEKCKNCGITDFCQCCPASRYAETGCISGLPEYACLDAQFSYSLLGRGACNGLRKTKD